MGIQNTSEEVELSLDEMQAAELQDDIANAAFEQIAEGVEDFDVTVVEDEPVVVTEPAVTVETPAPEDTIEGAATDVTPTLDDIELEAADKAYPEPVQKRIKREIRIRKRVEGEFEQLRDAAVKVAELAQTREAESKQLQEQLVSLRRQHAEVLEHMFDGKIQLQMAELRRAREEGNFDNEAKIQSEIDQLRFNLNKVKDAKASLGQPTQPAQLAQPPQNAQPAQPAQPQRKAPPPGAIKWVEDNKAWYLNPKFSGHRAFVKGVEAELTREGYSDTSRDYYVELDRRIDEAFPTLRAKTPIAPSGGPAPVPKGGTGRPPAGGKRQVVLTKADLQQMRTYGLDPSNKEHLREFIRNREAA